MANLSVEEPDALMCARPDLWEPWAGNCPGPPGPEQQRRAANTARIRACGAVVLERTANASRGALRESALQRTVQQIRAPLGQLNLPTSMRCVAKLVDEFIQ